MNISVIIPAHNEELYVGPCIESILAGKTPDLREIIVVDNASTDRTADVAGRHPMVRVVREWKKGITHAREAGRKAATGEILAYVDADSRVPKDWLAMIEKGFRENPRLVCLSGPCEYYDFPAWKNRIVRLYWNVARPLNMMTGAMVLGSNFAARKEALETIGGFDTSIAFYGEDTNIARRLKKQGEVRFVQRFRVASSARRFRSQGLVATGTVYALNFLSESFLHRPATRTYRDIR